MARSRLIGYGGFSKVATCLITLKLEMMPKTNRIKDHKRKLK